MNALIKGLQEGVAALYCAKPPSVGGKELCSSLNLMKAKGEAASNYPDEN